MTTQRPTEVRLTAAAAKDYGYAAYGRHVDQRAAEYNALGGMGEGADRACANCLFFLSPNACTVVEDWPLPISPTGLSRFWTAVPTEADSPPMRVVIVEESEADSIKATAPEDAGLFARVVAAVKGAFSLTPVPVRGPDTYSGHDAGAFRLYRLKAADGSGTAWRWVAIVSNKYRDHDHPPEIIAEPAHREYVEWLDKSGEYPEAWLWHTPGTRWGKADFADYTSDGFLVMGGTVDKSATAEAVAVALSGQRLGVSHGFYQRYSDQSKGIIGWYRSFEVSALPPEAAANQWTAMAVLQKEAAVMAFTPAKRAFLETTLGAEKVRALEGDISGLAKALTDAGVEYKDLEAATGDVVVVPAATAVPALSAKDIGDAVTKGMEPLSVAMKELAGSIVAVRAQIDALDARTKALEKSDDDKIADAFKARTSGVGGAVAGYRASQSGDTALKDGEEAALGAAPALVNPKFMTALRGAS